MSILWFKILERTNLTHKIEKSTASAHRPQLRIHLPVDGHGLEEPRYTMAVRSSIQYQTNKKLLQLKMESQSNYIRFRIRQITRFQNKIYESQFETIKIAVDSCDLCIHF